MNLEITSVAAQLAPLPRNDILIKVSRDDNLRHPCCFTLWQSGNPGLPTLDP